MPLVDTKRKIPEMSRAGLSPTHSVTATDENGQQRAVQVAGEAPLTLKVDGREIVTLMTLGGQPEALALGYLRNQRLVRDVADIHSVQVDWERETVFVKTREGGAEFDRERILGRRIVTTGCGQGTIFSCTLNDLYDIRLPAVSLKQSDIYGLLTEVAHHNGVYRSAGAVHGCALCRSEEVLMFVEDVGRHNAADAIAGQMWLEDMPGADKIFYTTGRLTSEMVMKAGQMGIPVLLSRSGITHMGLELAQAIGLTLIARAKGKHFLVYHGAEQIEWDATD